MNKYFAKLNVSNEDILISKSLEFVKSKPDVFYRKKTNASFYEFDVREYLAAVPEMQASMQELGFRCLRAAVYVMYSNVHSSAHRDCLNDQARINFPLLNCKNSYTEFYENVKTFSWINPQTGLQSHRVVNDDFVLADRVEMTGATVIRVSEAHNVIMDESTVPRITLTIGVYPNPIFLLKKI